MNIATRSAVLFLLSFLVGCSFVKSPVPFGLEPVELSAEKFTGTWENEDGDDLEISVADSAKGLLELSYEEEDGPESSKHSSIKVHILAGRKWHYASVPAAEDGSDSEGFLFACIQNKKKRIIIWMPDLAKFRTLIEDGKIPGKIVKKDVILEKVTPEIIDIIESEKQGILFDWREPMIFRRKTSPEKD